MLKVGVPGLLQPSATLGSSLHPPWFVSSRAFLEVSLGDSAPEVASPFGPKTRAVGQGLELHPALADDLQNAFEAELPMADPVGHCGFEHEETDQVIDDHVHEHFFVDHLGRFGSQHLHSQSSLYVAEA